MHLNLYQVDAFTDKIFSGNPAAVVPLDSWLPDETLQNIALENNLSETAFFVSEKDSFRLRWFTPAREVDLCGHATLATAFVLFNILGHKNNKIDFETRSGKLVVRKTGEEFVMDFPAIGSHEARSGILTSKQDLMLILPSESDVVAFSPELKTADFEEHRGLIITAKGDNADFVSRCFYPELNIDEDPVTGSAHCQLAPYWAKVLGKTVLSAEQLSSRGGKLKCEVVGDRVFITGSAVLFMKGEINL